MRVRRIVATILIFGVATVAWVLLGASQYVRSQDKVSLLRGGYEGGWGVQELWGQSITQDAPTLTVQIAGPDKVRPITPVKNDIDVTLDLEHRAKGLIWYATYTCDFTGTYTIRNEEGLDQRVHLHFPLPCADATYGGFSFSVNGEPKDIDVNPSEGIHEIIELKKDQEQATFRITYNTRGLDEWRYRPAPKAGRVKGLSAVVKTNFTDIDFPARSLSPHGKTPQAGGMALTWTEEDLITTQDIGVTMPQRLNPGPLSSRMTFFAPVCLLFFFVLVVTINIVYKVAIHPMHYLFVSAGFFAFHLLFAYLVDHLPMHYAFAIAAVASVALVTLYLRAALGAVFPWLIAGAGQIFYLVLFSYSFFLKGMTGLTVTIGSVLTLAAIMAVTARIDWSEFFRAPPASNASGDTASARL